MTGRARGSGWFSSLGKVQRFCRTRGLRRAVVWIAVGVLPAVFAVLPIGAPSHAAAAPAVPAVGVVKFYAPWPVPAFVGVFPDQFATDDLSAALARAGAGQIAMVPPQAMRQAESALRWQGSDVLTYARLTDLAQRAHADLLVVGWIKLFAVGSDDGDRGIPSGGMFSGTATVVVQVFDPAQGRLVWETSGSGQSQGFVLSIVIQDILHRAIAPTVQPALSVLTGSGT